ncbi:MAG: hypothetical protein AAB899_04420, partial [Patescibacteria group bacterium]
MKKYSETVSAVFAALLLSAILLFLFANPVYAATDGPKHLSQRITVPQKSFASIFASFASNIVEDLRVPRNAVHNSFSYRDASSPIPPIKQKILNEQFLLAAAKSDLSERSAQADADELVLPKKESLVAASLAAVSSFANTLSVSISERIRDIVNSFRANSSDTSAHTSSNPPAPETENASAANDSSIVPPTSPKKNSSPDKDVSQLEKDIDESMQKPLAISGPITPNVIERLPVASATQAGILSVGGISEDILNQRLQQLDNKLTSQIFSVSAANSTQSVQTYQVIAQTNRINQLAGVAISNASITGSAFTGSVSATSLSAGGDTSLGNATTTTLAVTGNANVQGQLKIGTSSIFLNENATSTFSAGLQTTALNITSASASSTFANGINVSAGCFSIAGSCLSLGTITGTLAAGSGGTGTSTWQTNSIPYFNGTRLTESNSSLNFNGTKLTAAYASSTALSVSDTAYFGAASTTNLTVSGTASSILSTNSSGAVSALTVGNGLSFSGNALSTAFGTTTANTWTALQSFANASTTLFSSYGPAYFGGSATSSFSSTGVLTLGTALAVGSGGTGQTSFGQGWLSSNGTTISASTSPTVNYVVATSTTLASTFPYASSTALTVSGTGYFGTATSTTLNANTASLGSLTLASALPVTSGGTGATSLNNLITLGDHTTGNYVATLANAGGLTIANSGSETAAVTAALNMGNSNW